MNAPPKIDTDLINELVDYAQHEATKIIPDLYTGLNQTEMQEVITDTLARITDFSLPHEPDVPTMENLHHSTAVIEKYRHYTSYLLQALPLFTQKAWARRRKEVKYRAHIVEGLIPFGADIIDEQHLGSEEGISFGSYVDDEWV